MHPRLIEKITGEYHLGIEFHRFSMNMSKYLLTQWPVGESYVDIAEHDFFLPHHV